MIKYKINPELKSKFQDAINKTKENGEEHGFYICEDNKGLSSSELKFGKDRRINLGDPVISCHGKKVQGNFHTHSYLTLFKQKSRFMKPGMSDEDVKKFIKDRHSEHIKESKTNGITIDSPSPKDLLTSILYNCIGKSEGIMCVGSDMGNDKVECWIPKEIPREDCYRAYHALYDDSDIHNRQQHAVQSANKHNRQQHAAQNAVKEKETIPYQSWMTSLFNKEIIDLKKRA